MILLILFLPFLSSAANRQSVASGAWNSTATWGGSIPGSADDVTISAGHSVFVTDANAAITIRSLTVASGAEMLLGKANFTVLFPTSISGRIQDLKREGTNLFKALVTFNTGAIGNFIESYGTGGIVSFENGLVHNGDSLTFGRVEFITNSQSISGSSLVDVIEKIEIGNGITLTNANTSGIRLSNANVDGLGAGAVFRNESKLDVLYQFSLMATGSVDFSFSGNEVIYRMASDQQITPGTYSRLLILKDGVSLFRKRFLVGDVTVEEYFFVQDTSTFEPKEFNFTVTGLTQISGRFSDKFVAGTNTFQDVVLSGLIEGSGQAWGTYMINGNLSIDGTKADMRHANLQIMGVTSIPSGSTLAVNNNEGPRVFGDMVIDAGGTFSSFADQGVELSGMVTNNGSFYWKYGILSGNLLHEGDTAWINKLDISGPNAEISGSQRVWIKDQVNLASGAVLTNSSSGGVYLYDRAKVNGADATSIFKNTGELHNQTDNTQMETGEFDGNYPGSVVYFDRQLNLGQKISPGSFYDVIVLGGQEGAIRKISMPNDTMKVYNQFIMGDNLKYEPQKSTLICYGHAVMRGEIFDGDQAGFFQFKTVDVSGAKFTGANNANGTYYINGEMQVLSGNFEFNNGSIYVFGKVSVAPQATFTVKSRNGYRDFGRLEVAAGGSFLDETGGDTLHFSGKIINYGNVDITFPVLKGGLEVESDATDLFSIICSGTPVLGGSRPLIVPNKVLILKNSTMISFLDSLVFIDKALFVGEDSSSVFDNRGTMYWENNSWFLETGTMDCSKSYNTIVYQYRKGDLEIRPGTYWNLKLPTDPTRNLPKRRVPEAGITILGNLILDWNVELQPKTNDVTVNGTAFIYGKMYDDERDGVFTAREMVLGNAIIEGNSSTRYGSYVIQDSLKLTFGETNWERASLEVKGILSVTDSAIFNLNTNTGKRDFNQIYVGEKSLLNENGNGQNTTIDGLVTVGGDFKMSFGTFTFADRVHILEGGKFSSTGLGSTYAFLDTLEVEGLMTIPQSTCDVKGPFIGSGNLIIQADLLLQPGDTLINEMTGADAFMMRGELNGADKSAHFLNKGIFRYGPRNNASLMANGGSYDFLSYPANWVIFDGTSGSQPIPDESFLNIGFMNGGNKAIAGDSLKILGDVFFDVELRKDPDIFSSGIVLFIGENDQTIDGKGVGSIQNMVVRKNGGSLTVIDDFGIGEGLVMKQGILTADPGYVGISGSGFIQESPYSYILGRVGSERNINQGQDREFGGMGINIKPLDANMGPTLVYRVTGKALEPGQITRYYEVYPTNNSSLNATVEVGYHERDLNGAVETDLQVTHKADFGGEFEVLGGGTYRVSNFVRKTGIERLGVLSLVPSTMAVNAYPSPFTGESLTTTFVLREDDAFVDLRIFDMAGREWAHQTIEGVAGLNTVDFDNLQIAAGTYVLRVVSKSGTGFHYVQKLTP
ncbi:MAG: T9SS type A sorting domain-containing protein [Bacteroidia bacterium]|nr:T9SS type A sorting domain-containing protein [Bacteroidia bacterium]